MTILPSLCCSAALIFAFVPLSQAQDTHEKAASEAALAFARAMAKADVEVAKKLVRKDQVDKAKDLFESRDKGKQTDPAGLKVVDVRTVVTIAGPDVARVQLEMVKENGEWKVDVRQLLELLDNLEQARVTRVDADLEALKTQLLFYDVRNGSFPSTKQGLKALVERPEGEPVPRKWSKLMQDLPTDPWGNVYQFQNPSTKGAKDGYDLFSAGPDGKPGTADDIGNW